MTTLPTWVVVMLGLASPLVAVVAIVVGWLRERSRQDHERKLQRTELEDQRMAKLREERLKAYATFARLTSMVNVSAENPEAPAVVQAHWEVDLLAGDPKLREVAGDLARTWESAWRSVRNAIDMQQADPYDVPGYKNLRGPLEAHRSAFIERARAELEPAAQGHMEG